MVHTLKLLSEGKFKVKGRGVVQKGKIISSLPVDEEICNPSENNVWGNQE